MSALNPLVLQGFFCSALLFKIWHVRNPLNAAQIRTVDSSLESVDIVASKTLQSKQKASLTFPDDNEALNLYLKNYTSYFFKRCDWSFFWTR